MEIEHCAVSFESSVRPDRPLRKEQKFCQFLADLVCQCDQDHLTLSTKIKHPRYNIWSARLKMTRHIEVSLCHKIAGLVEKFLS